MRGPIIPNKQKTNAMFTFWAQLMDHDFGLTEDQPEKTGEHIDIAVAKGDPFFDPTGKGDVIIPQIRSLFTKKEGKARQFPNSISSLVDGTVIYGFDKARMTAIREFKDGRMKVSDGDYLPFDPAMPGFHLAGDKRVNENLGLSSVHTLLVREHNRRAAEIS